jgi:hypothetical protein
MALKIGLIGLDTSHAIAFTKRLNDANDPEHVPGGKVVAAFPGGSPDMQISISRVEGFTTQLRDEFKVQMMSSPEAVAEAVDIVFITSCDGRIHREQLERTLKFRRPTFVDKPFACTSEDARAMFHMADEAGTPVMSCSAVRYSHNLTEALKNPAPVIGIDAFGPMAEQAPLPGLYWYGVHAVDVMIRALGTGCQEVRAVRNEHHDLITGICSDGRLASIRGLRGAHNKFGAVLHRADGYQFVDLSNNTPSYYSSMLAAILASLPNGKADIDPQATIQAMRFIEAANESRESGKPVRL